MSLFVRLRGQMYLFNIACVVPSPMQLLYFDSFLFFLDLLALSVLRNYLCVCVRPHASQVDRASALLPGSLLLPLPC
jgi:hypothetical protein